MPLDEYRSKRNFKVTPEPPSSKKKSGKKLIYVIQKHQASRLHYDLRLEERGVLRSWAIPKTPEDKPGKKYLAIATEDHPVGYENFEGLIPKPEYGAGTVEIWDRGEYEPVIRAENELVFKITGERLNGYFALIRIKDRKGSKNTWLFFKLKNEPGLERSGRKDGVRQPEK